LTSDIDRSPDIAISGVEAQNAKRICTYAWLRGEVWLYVGQSRRGLTRVLGHNVIGELEEIRDTDTILVWHCATEKDSISLERALIHKHQPVYNKAFKN